MGTANAAMLTNVVLQLLTQAQAYQAKIASGQPVTDADVDAAMLAAAQSHTQLLSDIIAARAAQQTPAA